MLCRKNSTQPSLMRTKLFVFHLIQLIGRIFYKMGGCVYKWTKKYDLAIADLDRAVREITLVQGGPTAVAGIYICRGAAYLNKGLYERALADYSEALKVNPGDPEARTGLAFAQQRLGLSAGREPGAEATSQNTACARSCNF